MQAISPGEGKCMFPTTTHAGTHRSSRSLNRRRSAGALIIVVAAMSLGVGGATSLPRTQLASASGCNSSNPEACINVGGSNLHVQYVAAGILLAGHSSTK